MKISEERKILLAGLAGLVAAAIFSLAALGAALFHYAPQ